MSAFTGPQGKGAAKRRREVKRAEAEARQAQFVALGGRGGMDTEVNRVAFEQNVSDVVALRVVRAQRRMDRRKAERSAS